MRPVRRKTKIPISVIGWDSSLEVVAGADIHSKEEFVNRWLLYYVKISYFINVPTPNHCALHLDI
jgi:hypothetical protein